MKTALFAAAGLGLAAAAGLPSKSDTLPAPPTQPAYVAHKPSCDDTKLSIYFPAHESMLSSYAIRALNATGDSLSGCAVTNIDVSVVSSDGAQAADRSRLSQQRASAVLEALADQGISAPRVETNYLPVKAVAEDGPALVEPMAGRVDVSLEVKPVYGL